MQQPMQDHKGLTFAYVALGSNATSSAGSPKKTLLAAKQAIPCKKVKPLAESRLFATPAVPKGHGPDFVNAVICVQTSLSSGELLAHLHRIEAQFDRVRAARWGARTVDLDLLAYGDAVLPDADIQAQWRNLPLDAQMRDTPEQLIVPHPRLQDRGFVLIPMADIAPDWVHPALGQSVTQMLDALPMGEKSGVVPIS